MIGDKYIVFNREQFFQLMGELGLPPYFERPDVIGDQGESYGQDWDVAPISTHIKARVEATEIKDAVVMRRQDRFATIPIEIYAMCVQLVVDLAEPKSPITERLTGIADYMSAQAGASLTSHRKIPD